jgi:superfamily II DNA or RNA helicase
MSLTLRPYQQQAVDAVKKDWAAGYTDVLGTAATGLGKTAIFLALLNDVIVDGRGLILAHRKELIEQPLERLFSYFPEWRWQTAGRAGIVMADQNQPDSDLVVATVQTLASPRRLEEVLRFGPIQYLITDEAHHATASTYRQVYERLREANPEMRHLGVTATPIRADGDGLAGVFQKESFHFGIVEGIREGFLAPVRWLAIQTAVSVAGVASREGDFVRKQLANVFETENCFDLVVESHKRYADGRQAVAFTVSVEGAYRLAEKFREVGITASAADGTTGKRERAAILDAFAGGRTQVLCNVGLYTEGLDVPQASCIHQVRPTRSDGLYTQMIGRALRTYPGKPDALILDYAPVETRNIAMLGDVLGIPLRRDSYIQPKEDAGEVMGGFTFDGRAQWLTGSPAEIIARQLDYLDLSPWSWYRRDGWMSLGLGKASDEVERTLLISPPVEGEMVLYGCAKRPGGQWIAYKLARGDFEELSQRADEYCNRWGNAPLATKQRAWRREPPTDKQIAFARRIKGAFTPGMTKGELAQSITHMLAVRTVQGMQPALQPAGVRQCTT